MALTVNFENPAQLFVFCFILIIWNVICVFSGIIMSERDTNDLTPMLPLIVTIISAMCCIFALGELIVKNL